jgi:hypothetical protein
MTIFVPMKLEDLRGYECLIRTNCFPDYDVILADIFLSFLFSSRIISYRL